MPPNTAPRIGPGRRRGGVTSSIGITIPRVRKTASLSAQPGTKTQNGRSGNPDRPFAQRFDTILRAEPVADRLPAAVAVASVGRAAILEALAAVDRLVRAGLEGDFRLLAARGADSRVHLARAAGVSTAAAAAVRVAAAAVSTAGRVAIATGVALRLARLAAASGNAAARRTRAPDRTPAHRP